MTDTSAPLPSLADRVRPIAAGAPVVGVHFLGSTPVFVLGEEALLFAGEGGEKRVAVHAGGILASASDGNRIVTGGDDGTLVATDARGEHRILATDDKRRWIDQVALGPDGAVAWSAGKTAHVLTKKGEERTFEAPSTVAGLAFAPKGFRAGHRALQRRHALVSQRRGPSRRRWNGRARISASPSARTANSWSPAMQEPTLHGWRLADAKHMRMSGYSARVRSLGWTADGEFLATSGSEQLILWPFDGKDGPMGRQPKLLARSQARVVVVACHPRQPVVAVGYADGVVMLVRIDDGALIEVKAEGAAPVSALGWDATGQTLAFGTEAGEAGALSF